MNKGNDLISRSLTFKAHKQKIQEYYSYICIFLSLERLKKASFRFLSVVKASQNTLVLADQAIVSATNFFTGVIVGRACAKEQFGFYMMGFSIILIIFMIQGSLISSPYTAYSPRLRDKKLALYTGSTLIHLIILSLVIVMVLLLASQLIPMKSNFKGFEAVLRILACVIIFIMLKEYARRICFAKLALKSALIIDLWVAIIQITSIFFFRHLGLLSATVVYLIVGLSCGIASLIWLFLKPGDFILGIRESISQAKVNWSFGKWLIAGDVALSLSRQIYPWIITALHGAAAAGVFAACLGIVSVFNPVMLGIGNLLGPSAARALIQSIKAFYAVIRNGAIILASLSVLLCMAIMLFGNRILVLVYTSKYEGYANILLILSLGFAAASISEAPSYGIWAMERTDVNFKINLIILGISLPMGFLLIHYLDLLGAAINLLVSNTTVMCVRYIVLRKLIRSHI